MTQGSKPCGYLRDRERVCLASLRDGKDASVTSEPVSTAAGNDVKEAASHCWALLATMIMAFLNFILSGKASHWRVLNRILFTIYSLFTKSCYMPDTTLGSRQL